MKTTGYFILLIFFLSLVDLQKGFAQGFTIKDIRIEGIQRISAGTVFNYSPVKAGDPFDESRFAEVIRSIYKSGYFEDVRLEKQGDILIINVVERPAIASIDFTGNKSFDEEDLINALSDMGLAEGSVYNKSALETVEQALQRQYFASGKYSIKIKSTVTPLERNRVAINFEISEGVIAKIKEINIVGNESYDDKTLLDEFELTAPTWYSILSTNDQYSKQKLAADLESLSSFYLDRGYLKFNIDSTQVSITPDKKDIYITINITEGDQYSIQEVKLSGKLLFDDETLFKAVNLRPGDLFSRKYIVESSDALTTLMSNRGYAFANINAIPDVNEEDKSVAITFYVDPGRRIYVNRINISGNSRTRDEVLRREFRQLENAWMSAEKIERTTTRLEKLGYFTSVNVETPAVPGQPDQVDVNYSVIEQPSGSLLAGLGYSQSTGISLSSSVTQDNWLGSGVRFGINFNTSDADTTYGLNFTDPYHTIDGVSRGFSVLYRKREAQELGVSDYDSDHWHVKVHYGIPVSETNTIRLGLSMERFDINSTSKTPSEIRSFTAKDRSFLNLIGTASWVDDKRNRSALFADRGTLNAVSTEFGVPGSDLKYYKISLRHQRFMPVSRDFTLSLNGELGLGDGYGSQKGLPFLEHFYAGGVSSVRGFEDNTLGPLDSLGQPFGGDLRVVANAELIMPMPLIQKDNKAWRMTAFLDTGNVYEEVSKFKAGDLRYSTGLAVRWLSPFGPIKGSLAQPLNSKSRDKVQRFQFTFGTAF